MLFSIEASEAKYCTCLDMLHAYLQVPLDEESQKMCTIVTHIGQYSFRRIPFGLNSAPSAFSKLIGQVLRGLINKCCHAFLDDLLIYI